MWAFCKPLLTWESRNLIVTVVGGGTSCKIRGRLDARRLEPTVIKLRSGRARLHLARGARNLQWWRLWLLLFLNTSAGISVISQEAPMFQELQVSAVVAAGW